MVKKQEVKNVIAILVDSLRQDCVTLEALNRFPSLQQLAMRSRVWTAMSAVACPTQMAAPSIFTSTLPLDCGGYDLGIVQRERSFVEEFQAHGYKTFGVVSGSGLSKLFGFARGFDTFIECMPPEQVWFSFQKIYFGYYLQSVRDGRLSVEAAAARVTKVLHRIHAYLGNPGAPSEAETERIIRDAPELIAPRSRTFSARLARASLQDYLLRRPRPATTAWAWINRAETTAQKLARKLGWEFSVNHTPFSNGADVTTRLLNGIATIKNAPFLAIAHYMDLHDKKLGGDRFRFNRKSRFAESAYFQTLTTLDREIGRVTRYLDEQKLSSQTAIVLLSDHGYPGSRPHRSRLGLSDTPFYEEFVRVPFWIAHPLLAPGVSDALCSTIDIAPTLLELCGLPRSASFQGVSLLDEPALNARDYVLMEHALRGPCDLLIKPHHIAVRTRTRKFIWRSDDGQELYDLERDLEEMRNVANAPEYQPEVVRYREIAERRFAAVRARLAQSEAAGW